MNEPESVMGAGGGVGPLHEAIATLPVMWHGPKDATVGNGTGETAMSRSTKSRMLAVVDALLEHPE